MANERALVVCENLLEEFREALRLEGLDEVRVAAWGACLKPGPQREQDLQQTLEAVAAAGLAPTLVLPGCTPNAATLIDNPPPGLKTLHARRCFDLVVDPALADHYLSQGAFGVTPGWLARWAEYLKAWGFGRDTARTFFGESIRKVLLFDTGLRPKAEEDLRDFAEAVGLPAERLPVGLDHLRIVVRDLFGPERPASDEPPAAAAVQAEPPNGAGTADYAMALDLTSRMIGALDETAAVEQVSALFQMLFAPRIFRFVPASEKAEPRAGADDASREALERWLSESAAPFEELGREGFRLRIAYGAETLGAVEMLGFAFPEHLRRYLNVALNVARVCGLAVQNARAHDRLAATIDELQKALAQVRTLRGLIPICSYCKKMRDDQGYWQRLEIFIGDRSEADFSHSLCPDCIREHYPDLAE